MAMIDSNKYMNQWEAQSMSSKELLVFIESLNSITTSIVSSLSVKSENVDATAVLKKYDNGQSA